MIVQVSLAVLPALPWVHPVSESSSLPWPLGMTVILPVYSKLAKISTCGLWPKAPQHWQMEKRGLWIRSWMYWSGGGILECQSGLPSPSPGDLPSLGSEPASLTPPALAGGFFTASATWGARHRRLHGGVSLLAGGGCEILWALPKCDRNTKRVDAPGEMAPIDLLNTGLPQTFHL